MLCPVSEVFATYITKQINPRLPTTYFGDTQICEDQIPKIN